VALWFKSTGNHSVRLFGARTDANNYMEVDILSDYRLRWYNWSGGIAYERRTTQVLRDPSAWYHLVFAFDSTQATASNRLKLYINGSEVTAFDTQTNPSQNFDDAWNNSVENRIGTSVDTSSSFLNGYLADIYFIDGQALTPSSFTETDATTGQLIPKAYTGSYGTNGFKLSFSDNSTKAALGIDSSGNNNTWTVNNLYPGGANYSSRGSLSASPPILSGTIADIFDGSLAAAGGSFSVNQANAGVTVSFSPALPSGSLVKLIGSVYGTASSNSSLQVNGTSYAQSLPSSPGTGTDTELSVPAGTSGITSIYIYREGVSDFNYTLFGITVDGILLVDAAAGASLVDVPSSSGTDTGAGGEVRGNYATLNPLNTNSGITLSNGNLDASSTSNAWKSSSATIGIPNSNKWYFEVTQTAASDFLNVGIVPAGFTLSNHPGSTATSWAWQSHANKWNNNTNTAWGSTTTTNDVIMIAVDRDSGKMWAGKNGTWFSSGNPASGTNEMFSGITGDFLFPALGHYSTTSCVMNFGGRPFAYTAPSGFKALCTANLPAPVVTKPNTVMDVKLYTGTGATQNITGLAFSPDLVWAKVRNTTGNHSLYDIVRGATQRLASSTTSAEATFTNSLTSFDSGGFSLGSNPDGDVNASGNTYVAWTWDAGSSTVTNTSGSITSSVRANATAGFSVVTYTGNSTAGATVGHGLGVAPAFIISKSRSNSSEWSCYHQSLGNAQSIILNTTAAAGSSSTWNSTSPTSTVITLGVSGSTNFSGYTHVIYAFAPVVGYSSFGIFNPTGTSDSSFVYCGFRPRLLLVKQTTNTSNWIVWDTSRDSYNYASKELYPNLSDAEVVNSSTYSLDVVSNGFKMRNPGMSSGSTWIYCAWAEVPFNYARAR
jgi:hypothetical protein